MMTEEQATKLAKKYEEMSLKYVKKYSKAWTVSSGFLYAKICFYAIEKLYELTSDQEWRELVGAYAEIVAEYGSKLKPEKYAQLNELARETFRNCEVGFGDCGE